MTSLKSFQYHVVSEAQAEEMALIRSLYYETAKAVSGICPEGRSQSLALTYLENSLMRAIQSIALEGQAIDIGIVKTEKLG